MIYVFISDDGIKFYDNFNAHRYREHGMFQHMWNEKSDGIAGHSMMDEFEEWVNGINERMTGEIVNDLDLIDEKDAVRCFLAENEFIPVSETLFYKK